MPASASAGADVIIAQGRDAGGHSGVTRGTIGLVPAVVDAVGPIPVVAAGGIADGRGLAAALSLGASGVSMGARFTATRESLWDQAMKEKAVASSGDQTADPSLRHRPRRRMACDLSWAGAAQRLLRPMARQRGIAARATEAGRSRLSGEPRQ